VIVAKSIKGTDPVHKVTIIPRGQALGLTQQLPEEDRMSMDEAVCARAPSRS
jgi:cell division protease FtsH